MRPRDRSSLFPYKKVVLKRGQFCGDKGKSGRGIFLTGFRKRVKLGPENGFMPGCEKAS